MKRNLLFILLTALLLAPWPVVYAYEGANADNAGLTIIPADTAIAPQFNDYGQSVGKVTPGELFRVDLTGTAADTPCKLWITNMDDITPNFRFLSCKIGIYAKTPGTEDWGELTLSNGQVYPNVSITMVSGLAEFTLPGGAVYKITIDAGCFHTYGAAQGTEIAAPVFYLTAGT